MLFRSLKTATVVLLSFFLCFEFIMSVSYNPHYSQWMENIQERLSNQTISQIFLPGTHEASSYNLTNVPSPDEMQFLRDLARKYSKAYSHVVKPWGECQTLDTFDQLMRGSRLLDWRVSYRVGGKHDPLGDVNDFFTCHGLWGSRFSDMLTEVIKFMESTTKEYVFIEISHFNEFTPERYTRMQQLILDLVGEYMVQKLDFPHANPENFFEVVSFHQLFSVNAKRRLFIFIEPYTTEDESIIQPSSIFFNYSSLNIPWANQNVASNAISELEKLMKNASGTWNELYGVQFLLTPQMLDFVLGIVLEFIPGYTINSISKLANTLNKHLDQFANHWFRSRKVNSMIVDHIETTSIVDHAIWLNAWNCHDNPLFKDPKQQYSCQTFKDQGRCTTSDEFMKENCKYTCGFCPPLNGFPGSTCVNSSDCYFKDSQCKYSQCLIPNAYPLGHVCGANFECSTGFCNPETNLCSGRFINDVCDTNLDCQNSNCDNGVCTGETVFKVIGESPICKAYEEDCLRSGMMFVSQLKGDANGECTHFQVLDFSFDGRKMLCVNAHLQQESFFWLSCGSQVEDCQEMGAKSLYLNNCSDNECCPEGQFQVLCAK